MLFSRRQSCTAGEQVGFWLVGVWWESDCKGEVGAAAVVMELCCVLIVLVVSCVKVQRIEYQNK
jgi:hypothetical protein